MALLGYIPLGSSAQVHEAAKVAVALTHATAAARHMPAEIAADMPALHNEVLTAIGEGVGEIHRVEAVPTVA